MYLRVVHCFNWDSMTALCANMNSVKPYLDNLMLITALRRVWHPGISGITEIQF